MEICPKCGLPKQACVCEKIAKGSENIKVTAEKKRYGKYVTIVSGLNEVNVKEVAKALKNELACGGTFRENEIELQGDHRKKIKEALVKLGFNPETIDWDKNEKRKHLTKNGKNNKEKNRTKGRAFS